MSRGLHYATEQEMPDSMRARLPAAPAPRAGRGTPRHPRRDEEHEQQVIFFNRIRTLALNDTCYALAVRRTFAIPNGGGRSPAQAGRLKAEGVRKGVSDIFCALPNNFDFCGLFIEMKSSAGRLTDEQKDWIEESNVFGYFAHVARSADDAFAMWKSYVDGTLP